MVVTAVVCVIVALSLSLATDPCRSLSSLTRWCDSPNADGVQDEVYARFEIFGILSFAMLTLLLTWGSQIFRPFYKVFLDRACIAQHDEVLKAAGVQALPAALLRSDILLCLFNEKYFDRLWPMYEIALFSKLHPIEDIVFVNIYRAAFFIPLSIMSLIWTILYESSLINQNYEPGSLGYEPTIGWEIGLQIIDVLYWTVWFALGRDFFKAQIQIRRRAEEFDVTNCNTALDSDRVFLIKTIDTMFCRPGVWLKKNLDEILKKCARNVKIGAKSLDFSSKIATKCEN